MIKRELMTTIMGVEHHTVSWVHKPCSYDCENSETIQLPNMALALGLATDADRDFLVEPTDQPSTVLARIASNVICRLQEEQIRRVIRAAQVGHWPWVDKINDGNRARFLALCDLDVEPPADVPGLVGPCRMWRGAKTKGGGPVTHRLTYGTFAVYPWQMRAHIFAVAAWETLDKMPHLPGQHVDHLCKRTLCVAPLHLQSVPPLVNLARRWGK